MENKDEACGFCDDEFEKLKREIDSLCTRNLASRVMKAEADSIDTEKAVRVICNGCDCYFLHMGEGDNRFKQWACLSHCTPTDSGFSCDNLMHCALKQIEELREGRRLDAEKLRAADQQIEEMKR